MKAIPAFPRCLLQRHPSTKEHTTRLRMITRPVTSIYPSEDKLQVSMRLHLLGCRRDRYIPPFLLNYSPPRIVRCPEMNAPNSRNNTMRPSRPTPRPAQTLPAMRIAVPARSMGARWSCFIPQCQPQPIETCVLQRTTGMNPPERFFWGRVCRVQRQDL